MDTLSLDALDPGPTMAPNMNMTPSGTTSGNDRAAYVPNQPIKSAGTVAVATMALETEMEECYSWMVSGQVNLRSNNSNRSAIQPFIDAFHAELERVSTTLDALNHFRESQARALLKNADGLARSTGKNKNVANIAAEVSGLRQVALNMQAEEIGMIRLTRRYAGQLAHIAKTADSKIGTPCLAVCDRRMRTEPWTDDTSSSIIIILLSDIFQILRSIEQDRNKNSINEDEWVAPSTFDRSTTKYWVAEEDLSEVLLKSVSELPILVYGRKGRLQEKPMESSSIKENLWKSLASTITSVYFDSANMDLYRERIARSEGAQLVRVRWYGDKPIGDDVVFLELKTHHEKWSGMKSAKERIAIKESTMRQLIDTASGVWTTEYARDIVLSANPNKKDKDKAIEKGTKLLLEIRDLVCNLKLVPCVRTTYTRVALQSSTTNDLRLTIDRDITVVDETKAAATANTNSWCLSDDAVIPWDAIVKIPYGVFEVKVAEGESPEFLQDLEDSNAIVEAKKFSKFLTGAAIHNTKIVSTLPWWATDPAFASLFKTTSTTDLACSTPATTKSWSSLTDPFGIAAQKMTNITGDAFAAMDGKECKEDDQRVWGANPEETDRETVYTEEYTISPITSNEGDPLFVSETSRKKEKDDIESGWKAIYPDALLSATSDFFRRTGNNSNSKPAIHLTKGKPPDAKTYFANERTFLRWSGISVTFVTFGSLIANLSSANSKIVLCLFGLALFAVLYAVFQYYRRMRMMKSGKFSYGYADYYGPGVFSTIMVMITCLMFFYTIRTPNQGTILIAQEGTCVERSLEGVSNLMFQPCDVFVDEQRGLLLVPSLDEIVGFSSGIPARSNDKEPSVQILADNMGEDVKALQYIGSEQRLYALSGEDKKPTIIAMEWTSEGKLVSKTHWEILSSFVTSMVYVPTSTLFEQAVLIVASEERLDVYDAPLDQTESALKTIHKLNFESITRGLNDTNVAAMQYFEDLLFLLFDNEQLIRAVDKEGNVVQDVRIPTSESGFGKQWKGMNLQRMDNTDLILHLALNAPAQIWSVKLDLDDSSGSGWKLPGCASKN